MNTVLAVHVYCLSRLIIYSVSLQILQQQQRADREAALSDLEECKRIFLERLRRHQGTEREVVEEALAFAGEPVYENDNSHEPSYPCSHHKMHHFVDKIRSMPNTMKLLSIH